MQAEVYTAEVRGTQAADTVEDLYVSIPAILGGDWNLREVNKVPFDAATFSATNYATLTVYGQDGTTSLGTISVDAVSDVAGTKRTVTLTESVQRKFNAGDVMKLAITMPGTGLAQDAMYQVTWEKMREP